MFNLPGEIVVFDTEYTTWEGAMERDWGGPNEHREVVQIGAVRVETDDFKELNSFSVFVKPKINPQLSEYFTELTGITQGKVDEGLNFKTAIEKFFEWSEDMPLYSKTGGDTDVLIENCKLLGIPFPFEKSRFFEIESTFQRRGIPIENYVTSRYLEAFGKKSTRRGHNALNDARTIADALRELKKQFGSS